MKVIDKMVLLGIIYQIKQKQVKGIVGFKMEIEEIDAAYKLSQNRSDIDKKNIVSELNKSVNPVDTVLAKEIEDNK